MLPKKLDPAELGGASGARECDLAGRSIDRDNNPLLQAFQASRITRRCAVSFGMALIIAPLFYGEAPL